MKLAVMVIWASIAGAGVAFAEAPADLVPVIGTGAPGAIAGRYIVVFKPGSAAHHVSTAAISAERAGGKVDFTYSDALQGFAARLPDAALQGLRHNPNIEYVEADQVMNALQTYETAASWNLDRINQRALPLDRTYGYSSTGLGVTSYVIDTGIRPTHTEFTGRASVGFDAVGDGRNGIDCNGHGTHVAGTIGGYHYGVAKDVSLVAVRVLDCNGSGTISGVIAGVDWVTRNKHLPAVANMSLGGGVSSSLDTAVKNSIAGGVTYTIAAGNNNSDACKTSPARVTEAITVAATTSTDSRASYSNYGACVDLFAPGSSVTSAWNTSDSATNTISGTSMATPNANGVAAQYLQLYPTATPAAVTSAVNANATAGVVTNPGPKSTNRLLYTNY